MKINYHNPLGKRSSITLSNALVDTWLTSQDDTLRLCTVLELTQALRIIIEATPRLPEQTFQTAVETRLLNDVRDHIHELEMRLPATL